MTTREHVPATYESANMKNYLLAVSILTALVYWILRAQTATPFSLLLKWLAIASLAVLVWQQRQSWQETLLVVALCFHSVGDVLLDWDRTKLFLPAVGTFMVGHALYLVTFWPSRMALSALPVAKQTLVGTLVLYGIAMAAFIIPHLPKNMLAMVAVYMFVILAMAFVATCANFRNPWVIVGALLYVLSDSLIAVNTFVRPLGAAAHLIWPLYYAGQLLIVTGFLNRNPSAHALAAS